MKNIDECHEINQKQFDKIIEKLDKLIKDKDSNSKPSPKKKE
ncbi:hypothetical protein [Candidatus Phytoplasma sp. AldY-WA1]|nr:hypothetical protein [Candidatus Phytoplasma sp. AldY-WA1]